MVCLNSQTMGHSLCAMKWKMTTLMMNCSCGGHLSLHTTTYLHQLHTRDIDHLVQELQLWRDHGLQNSRTMRFGLCTTTRKSTTIDELQLRIFRSFLQSEQQARPL